MTTGTSSKKARSKTLLPPALILAAVFLRPPPPVTSLATSTKQVTVGVCTGADCRVDGASDCLRRLQQQVAANNAKDRVNVRARRCLGPCGDGPCVVIKDEEKGKKIVVPQEDRLPGSLVDNQLFGDSNVGVYQVRTQGQLEFVLQLAGLERMETDGNSAAAASSNNDNDNSNDGQIMVVTNQRKWYDRPRNERKMLQRFGQFLVVVGLFHYDDSHDGGIGNVQWGIAFALLIASNLIMKENLLERVLAKVTKKRQP